MTKHTKIEFGFGLKLSKHNEPLEVKTIRHALSAFKTKAGELFGGCTLVATVGSWISPDSGVRFDERGCTLFVLVRGDAAAALAFNAGKINVMVELIKDRLVQEAVYVTVSEVLCALK